MNTQTERVAIDIHDLSATKAGQKLENALIANGATIYMTARQRKALLIGKKNFGNLQKRMLFTVKESFDGTVEVLPAPEPEIIIVEEAA